MKDQYDDIINLPHHVYKNTTADVNGGSRSAVFPVCGIDRL